MEHNLLLLSHSAESQMFSCYKHYVCLEFADGAGVLRNLGEVLCVKKYPWILHNG
jgi:hypothetical protein